MPQVLRNSPEVWWSAERDRSEGVGLNDRYAGLLLLSLLGYAFMGRGFAYSGIPPLFVGEIILFLGLFAALRSGALLATMATLPSLLLVATMAWVLVRTIPIIASYGMDALRDSVIVLYGLFAFIVAALLLEKPSRMQTMIGFYTRFSGPFVYLAPLLLIISVGMRDIVPIWPHSPVPMFSVRTGEVAAHLAGVTVFALLGFRQVGWIWSGFLLLAMAVVSAQSRGGTLAFLIPVVLALVLSGSFRRIMPLAVLGLGILSLAAITNLEVQLPTSDRKINVEQMIDNVSSIVGSSEEGNLDGTKKWRKEWWQAIIGYTFNGEHFWTGQGFGINLAVADGFVVGTELGGPLLRSPHNAHLTILARAGVPGLVLWGLLLGVWLAMLFRNMLVARRLNQPVWGKLFIFLGCYNIGILVNATFDVALEGPMLGIWFWSIFGAGLGASLIFWSLHPLRSGLLFPSVRMLAVMTLVLSVTLMQASESHADSAEAVQSRSGISASPSDPLPPCLAIRDRNDLVVERRTLGPCASHGIEIINSKRIVLRDLTIEGTGEIGIRVLGSEDIVITGSRIANTLSGIHIQSSRRIRIRCNTIVNPRGPIPRGQAVQFNEVHGPGNEIACNRIVNEPGRGNPEDAISIYRSSGAPEAPLLVSHNWIRGGGPSQSGGGIMLGDDGGAYLAARGNILEDPGQYGIGVAAGHHIDIVENVVRARQQPFTNVGIYVWRQYPRPCHAITVRSNQVSWLSRTGIANPWWNGGNCGDIDGLSANTFAGAAPVEAGSLFARTCQCGH